MPVATIRSARDAEALLRTRAFAPRTTIVVAAPGASPEQALQWELDLNAHVHECGCALGARFTIGALGACVVWQLLHLTPHAVDWLWFAARTFGLMFVAGGVGKMLGLARARAGIAAIARRMRALETSPLGGRGVFDVDVHEMG